jgi:hypothetical protein
MGETRRFQPFRQRRTASSPTRLGTAFDPTNVLCRHAAPTTRQYRGHRARGRRLVGGARDSGLDLTSVDRRQPFAVGRYFAE